MASTMFPLHNLLAPFAAMADRLFARPGRALPGPAQRPIQAVRAASIVRPTRPLRVVRVFDGPRMPQAAGRMVISGHMADVCAELDRLAALEARH